MSMKYTAIENFTDLQDNGHKYNVGDTFPHEGLQVSKERIDELMTCKNRRRRPMIVADGTEESVKEDPKEPVSEPQKDVRDVEADVHPAKTSKAKKSTKKG